MTERGEPLYKQRPHAPEAARFGRCERINDFILMSEGTSNSYLIETADGNVLVNTGMAFESPVHRANYESLAPGAIEKLRYIVVTQGHVDHVGGVEYFRELNPGVSFIATAANEEHQDYDARLTAFRSSRSAFRFLDDFMAVFKAYGEAGYTDYPPQARPTADIHFEGQYDIELGNLSIQLIAQPGAETNDSLLIWLPGERIVLTGNLFGCPFGHFPNLVTIRGDRYRDALTCAAAAQRVVDLDPELLLYGHHGPVAGAALIQREVSAIRDALRYVHDEVVQGMNAGEKLESLQQRITLPASCEVGEGYGTVAWSVRAIWEHYAGWFKHQSTTELYAVPQSDVYADLLELAGSEALISRAAAHADAGEREKALHLLDIVLGAEADNAAAIDLAIRVHESLLADARTFRTTGNFWLEGWLENRIKVLAGGREDSLASIIK